MYQLCIASNMDSGFFFLDNVDKDEVWHQI